MAYRLGVRTDLRTSDGAYVPSMGLGSRVGHAAGHGLRLRDARGRRDLLEADGDPQGRPAGRQGRHRRGLGRAAAQAGDPGLGRRRGHADPRGEHDAGHRRRRVLRPDRPPARPGTTDNYADAWFCGFTPELEATIWIGYPKGEIPMTNVHGIAVSGPTFPATIWKLFMERALDYAPFPKEFPTPKSSPVWITHKLQYADDAAALLRRRARRDDADAPTTTSSGKRQRRRLLPGPRHRHADAVACLRCGRAARRRSRSTSRPAPFPDGGLFRAARFRDVHLYQGFADAVFDGRVPVPRLLHGVSARRARGLPAAGGLRLVALQRRVQVR